MIGLDSNVLVRYLAQDDPVQSKLANEVIDGLSEDEPGFVSVVVLVEVAWILNRAYDMSLDEVHSVLERLVGSRELVFQAKDAVRRALRRATNQIGLPDALIAEFGKEHDCTHIETFDKKAADLPGMRLVQTGQGR